MNDKADIHALTYSVTDAAKAIGISRSKLYMMIASGDMPCVRLGGRTLIRRTDINKLLEENVSAS